MGFGDELKHLATNPVGTVEGWFGHGDPTGDDHRSSHWPAWGHDEIRSMLDNTVDAQDINAAADAWRDQARRTHEVITGFTKTCTALWTTAGATRSTAALPT